MNITALRPRNLALALALVAAIPTASGVESATTEPVGYYTVTITAGADNVLSLPMIRDAVFAGTVSSAANSVSSNGFTALAGTSSPGWTVNQWQYAAGTQPLTYYVEFTSGALKGLYYQITSNDASSLSLDMEGDSLTAHLNDSSVKLVAGDSFRIRPYWRISDVFESGGVPVLKARTSPGDTTADSILFPTYPVTGDPNTIGTNKSAALEVYYLGTGWRAVGQAGSYGDQIIRPNEAIVVRRRGATNVNLTNLGNVLMNRGVYF